MADYNIVAALPSRGFVQGEPTKEGADRWKGDGISLTHKPGLGYWLLAGTRLPDPHDWLPFMTVRQLDVLLMLLKAYRGR